jgi:hypothetical protein
MAEQTLDKYFHSGATLSVKIKITGYTKTINDQTLKAIADLLYAGDTKRLHKSKKVVGIKTTDTYLHEEDKALYQVTSYKAGEIKKVDGVVTVTKVGEITIGKTGKVNNDKHTFT